jgi:hypothetical protein
MSNKYGREVKCSRCWQPWYGWGTICNDCRQIETLGEIAANSQRHTAPNINSSFSVEDTSFYRWGMWIFILVLNIVLDWWPIKLIWIGMKAMVFFSFGWWMGMEW